MEYDSHRPSTTAALALQGKAMKTFRAIGVLACDRFGEDGIILGRSLTNLCSATSAAWCRTCSRTCPAGAGGIGCKTSRRRRALRVTGRLPRDAPPRLPAAGGAEHGQRRGPRAP